MNNNGIERNANFGMAIAIALKDVLKIALK